jgi:hypothetical protein
MTYEEITNQPKFVRIVDSTYNPDSEKREMIGGEFEVRHEFYCDNTVGVWNKDKSDFWYFNRSDVVFLTPVKFNGKRIGIGDEVKGCGNWRKVYGYHWCDRNWCLDLVEDDNFEHGCYILSESKITDHRTSPKDLKAEECIAYLEKVGRITDGKIVR